MTIRVDTSQHRCNDEFYNRPCYRRHPLHKEPCEVPNTNPDIVTKEELNQEIERLNTSIGGISDSLGSHIHDATIHITPEEKESYNQAIQDIEELQSRRMAPVAYSGDYNDLTNIPTIDSELNAFSHNSVANKAITLGLADKVDRKSLHSVAFTGNYEQLNNKPILETSVVKNSSKGITSGAVWEAIHSMSDLSFTPISTDRIDEMFGEEDE